VHKTNYLSDVIKHTAVAHKTVISHNMSIRGSYSLITSVTLKLSLNSYNSTSETTPFILILTGVLNQWILDTWEMLWLDIFKLNGGSAGTMPFFLAKNCP